MKLVGIILKRYRNFILFVISGAIAFCVDSSLYYVFCKHFPYYFSRGLSFFCAVIFTWFFNRSITFKESKFKNNFFKEFVAYFGAMVVGGFANYSTFIILFNSFHLVKLYPVIGIAAGSISGLFINFGLSQYVLYKNK